MTAVSRCPIYLVTPVIVSDVGLSGVLFVLAAALQLQKRLIVLVSRLFTSNTTIYTNVQFEIRQ